MDHPFSGDTLISSISAIDIGTMPDNWEPDEEKESSADETDEDEQEDEEPLDWTIELVDTYGSRAALPLSHDAELYPLVNAVPRRANFLDSTEPTEILFRRFEISLADFAVANPDFDGSSVVEVRFIFDRSEKGAIIIDDISVSNLIKGTIHVTRKPAKHQLG